MTNILFQTSKRAQSVLSANQMAPITKAGVVAEQSKKTEAVGTDNKTKQPTITQLPPNISLQEQLERMQLTEAKEEEDEDGHDEHEGAAAESMEADADEGKIGYWHVRTRSHLLILSWEIQCSKMKSGTWCACGE